MAKFRILSFDGGGIRGLLTTRILRRLCGTPGLEHAFENVGLLAGTSSGGLIALGLAHGLGRPTVVEALAVMERIFEDGAEAFGPKHWLGPVFYRKYGTTARERAVRRAVGDSTTLGDLRRKVLITAFDLDNRSVSDAEPDSRKWKPKVFHNFAGEFGDRQMLAWKVALYTTALPGYFPSVDGYVDGGLFANNPSMCALAQVLDPRYEPSPKPALNDILMLSIGAGFNLAYMPKPIYRRGGLGWFSKYVHAVVDGTVGIADYQVRQILGPANYRRIAPEFTPDMCIALDDLEKIDDLKAFADDVRLEPHIQWMREHWMASDIPAIEPRQRPKTSKHVLNTTELTCIAPIREGFVGVFESRTFATRLRIVLRVLHALRVASREARSVKGVLDVVDAIRGIHAFQFTILNERQLLLTVSFTAPWEPYMRIIWRDLGPLMDLVLCHCTGYLESASDKGFERFAAYIRKVQQECEFFYPSSGLTIDDQNYLEKLEGAVRNGNPQTIEDRVTGLVVDDPLAVLKSAILRDEADAEDQARSVLRVLFGLKEMFDTAEDRPVLARATLALLRGSILQKVLTDAKAKGTALDPPLAWFDALAESASEAGARPDGNGSRDRAERQRQREDEIQGGILRPYKRLIDGRHLPPTHGVLLLARVTNAADARRFLRQWVDGYVTREAEPGEEGRVSEARQVYRNVAFTFKGLRQLGVPEAQLALMPKEFQEGMEARAGLLGDVRENHPDHWVLPEWNVDVPTHDVHPERPRVRMSLVDVVVQFTIVEPDGSDDWDETHPLYADVQRFVASARTHGVNVMSRQLMRNRLDSHSGRPRDHFGFIDGISQPRPEGAGRDGVKLGEILLGYENDRRDPAFADAAGGPDAATLTVRGSLLDNGTFLVLRKLEQHVDRARRIGTPVLEKMLGRHMDGTPLVPAAQPRDLNDFDYGNDREGRQCPLQAHIRRANPRNGSDTVRVPRILRRGMSYGPSPEGDSGADTASSAEGKSRPAGPERGLVFMAYNASIAEQYEVIQRWLTGGNSTGLFSGMRDPITGVPDVPNPGTFRHFTDPSGGPPIGRPDMPAAPLVSLRWGTYLFVPSFAAVQQITADPVIDVRRLAAEQAAAGGAVMARLQTADEWAAIYEDSTAINAGITEAVSAAIRSRHGGVRRSPYGVLVTSERLVMEVLGNDAVFSVAEYRTRMGQSIGQIYLGLDAGDRYDALSYRPNAEIQRVSAEMAFRRAWDETLKALTGVLETTQTPALFSLEKLADQALAQMSKAWFGIPDGQTVLEGGRPAPGDTAPRCPFHTLAPSRYIFSSPSPRPPVAAAGAHLGRHLLAGVKAFVSRFPDRRSRRALAQTAPLSAAVFEAIGDDPDAVASNLVGLLEGFLPTVYGNFIKTMHLWIGDESLWRLQQDLCEQRDADYFHARHVLQEPLEVAMMKHPVPDLLYRTANRDVELGGLRVRAGERVVLSIVGATSDLRQQGRTSTAPIFGGYRSTAGHPTHACPGYEMAMGVLLGMVAATLQSGTLVPAPHPFLKLGDPRPFYVKAQTAAALPT